MEWPRSKRYRTLNDISETEYNSLLERVNHCPYRETYHIQPKTGLLNDPNGLSFFQGEYHLFYQWFPLGPVHGLKHWYHVSSKDLVHWKDCGIGLSPEKYYESHGVFSGTGFVKGDQLYLFYTGNTRDKDWIRTPYQCLAVMDSKGNIVKHEEPLICDSPKEYTDNFRDPKVFQQDDTYYCLIGAETKENKGVVAYYSSADLIHWEYEGALDIPSVNGFMLECPDYFELNDQGILIFCAQGQKPDGDHFRNIFPAGYVIGDKIDFKHPEITGNEYQELDRGFDFYAPQTTLDEKGRRILVGWLGLPGVDCITDENEWAHCLTLPRELQVIDGRLYQKPAAELENIRKNQRSAASEISGEKTFDGFCGKIYNLECTFTDLKCKKAGVKLRAGENEETLFYLDKTTNKLVLNREKSGRLYAEEYGQIRQCDFDEDHLKLQIFVDTSSIEIFVNDGLEVFTTRIYTQEESQGITFFAEGNAKLQASIWDLKL